MFFSLSNETSNDTRSFQLTDLQVLYRANQDNASIQHHFEDIFVRFETQKCTFAPKIRQQWRQQFLGFAEECQKRNLSQEIVTFALMLADHAYKLPERMYMDCYLK